MFRWPHSPLPPRVYKGLPAVCSPSLFVRGSGLVSPAIAAEERQRNVSPVHGDGERPQLQQTRYVRAHSLELSNHDFFAAVDCQSRVRGFVSRCCLCIEKSPPQILLCGKLAIILHTVHSYPMKKSQGEHSHSLGFGLKSKAIKLNWILLCSYWIKRFGFLCYFLSILNVAVCGNLTAPCVWISISLSKWVNQIYCWCNILLITFWTLTPPYVAHGIESFFLKK